MTQLLLVGSLDLLEVDLAMSLGQLCIELLVQLVVLDSAFVEFLLDSSLTDSFVSYIVKLGNEKIINLLAGILAHDACDCCCLLLE